jgi:hypothetical protein
MHEATPDLVIELTTKAVRTIASKTTVKSNRQPVQAAQKLFASLNQLALTHEPTTAHKNLCARLQFLHPVEPTFNPLTIMNPSLTLVATGFSSKPHLPRIAELTSRPCQILGQGIKSTKTDWPCRATFPRAGCPSTSKCLAPSAHSRAKHHFS